MILYTKITKADGTVIEKQRKVSRRRQSLDSRTGSTRKRRAPSDRLRAHRESGGIVVYKK